MIDIDSLTFSYGDHRVFEDVSFRAEPGEVVALAGPNGAGKSTLLHCIAGLLPYEGQVRYEGEAMEHMSDQRRARDMSYLPQDYNIAAALTVFEVVLLGCMSDLGMKVNDDVLERVESELHLLNIEHLAHRPITQISGGQRQLAFIAQALVKRPRILLLDEPTSALDIYKQFGVLDTIVEVTRQRSLTTIMTIHHLDLIFRYCDKVVGLHDGRLRQVGPPEEILDSDFMAQVYHVDSERIRDSRGVAHLLNLGQLIDVNPEHP
ncbi:MAG: ABC transporter ATP-binding protein [Flaviflexus sp.]|nr:ABC transporter ATP-binding protein [Flaviflexus sp.]